MFAAGSFEAATCVNGPRNGDARRAAKQPKDHMFNNHFPLLNSIHMPPIMTEAMKMQKITQPLNSRIPREVLDGPHNAFFQLPLGNGALW
jgi:hypothetical protein